jgi:hypothetical protein
MNNFVFMEYRGEGRDNKQDCTKISLRRELLTLISPFGSWGSFHWMTITDDDNGRALTSRGAEPGAIQS